jgi:hypothetical protein
MRRWDLQRCGNTDLEGMKGGASQGREVACRMYVCMYEEEDTGLTGVYILLLETLP